MGDCGEEDPGWEEWWITLSRDLKIQRWEEAERFTGWHFILPEEDADQADGQRYADESAGRSEKQHAKALTLIIKK